MCVCVCVASFPSLLHLQFLIACSMQTRRGETWGILSRDPQHIFAYCKRSKTGDVEGLGMRLSVCVCVCACACVCVRSARYGDIYRYRRYACTAVRFLDVNSIYEKRIIGKCTRQLSR